MLLTCKAVLLLFFANFFDCCVFAVTCHHCNDNAGTAGHVPADCPFITGVATNVAAIAAGTALTIRNILPSYLVNYMGSKVLSVLVSLKKLPGVMGAYDFSGKSVPEVVTALTEGVCKISEAVIHATTLKVSGNNADKEKGNVLLEVIAAMKNHTNDTARSQGMGYYRYLFHMLSNYVVKDEHGRGKFSMTGEAESSAEGGKSAKTVTVCLPRSEADFMCILNLFTLVGHATGIFNTLAFTPFLHEFILRSMSRHNMTWMMGYELLMVAFQHIEESTTGKSFADIMEGSQDTLTRTAERQGTLDFPGIFRTHGGIPGKPHAGGENVNWNGKFKKDASRACRAFNEGSKHTKDCLLADGTCKFAHVCNKWVSDKGPWGRCGGDHKASQCDHPHKCDEPIKP